MPRSPVRGPGGAESLQADAAGCGVAVEHDVGAWAGQLPSHLASREVTSCIEDAHVESSGVMLPDVRAQGHVRRAGSGAVHSSPELLSKCASGATSPRMTQAGREQTTVAYRLVGAGSMVHSSNRIARASAWRCSSPPGSRPKIVNDEAIVLAAAPPRGKDPARDAFAAR